MTEFDYNNGLIPKIKKAVNNEINSIKPETYFMVHWWMIDRINLRSNELLIFAYLYNISILKGKLTKKELSKQLSIPLRTASRATNNLFLKGYIQKKEKVSKNGLFCVYWIEGEELHKQLFK